MSELGRIIAIGGGEISEWETLQIDQYIVDQAGVECPRALFIPTASSEPEGYIETFHQVYGEKLGCQTDVLLLLNGNLTDEEIRGKILSADIIYVGGGDTGMMLSVWKNHRVDEYLWEAYAGGKILTGLSAGSICWFKYGHSEISENPIEFIRLEALGLIEAIHCPHYNEVERRVDFDEMMRGSELVGFAIEDQCAIDFYGDGKIRVIKAANQAKAYKITAANGEIHKEELLAESV
ncbi:Type 1 glutamine amidotransferase-like domain-containing protein [Pseudoneobacillus sp. C159]